MRTYKEFSELVYDSVEGQAKRKNYTDNGVEGENKLMVIMKAMGIAEPHGVGEIVYKCVEYLKNPREVLLIKIAGWAYIIWKGAYGECYTASDRESTGQGEINGSEKISKRIVNASREEGTRSVDRQVEGGPNCACYYCNRVHRVHTITDPYCVKNKPNPSQCSSGDATGTPY